MDNILSIELFLHGFIITSIVSFAIYFTLRDELEVLDGSSPRAYMKSISEFFAAFFEIVSQIAVSKLGISKPPPPSVPGQENQNSKTTSRSVLPGLFSIIIFFFVIYVLGTITSPLAKSWIDANKSYQLNLKALWMTNFVDLSEDFRDSDLITRSFNRRFSEYGDSSFQLTIETTFDSVSTKSLNNIDHNHFVKRISVKTAPVDAHHNGPKINPQIGEFTQCTDRCGDSLGHPCQLQSNETYFYNKLDRTRIFDYIKKQSLLNPNWGPSITFKQKLIDYSEVFSVSFFFAFIILFLNLILLSVRMLKNPKVQFALVYAIIILTIITILTANYGRFISGSYFAVVILLCSISVLRLSEKPKKLIIFPLIVTLLVFGGYFVCSKACILQKDELFTSIFTNYTPSKDDPKKIQALYLYGNYINYEDYGKQKK